MVCRAKRYAYALAPTLALVLTISLAFAAAAQALPAKFWGAVPQSGLSAEQYERIARGGVKSVRIALNWGDLQPTRNGPYEWGAIDASVERAALAGIDVLPTVAGAPSWAVPTVRVPGGGGAKAPARLPVSGPAAGAWKALLAAAVRRYGPNGEFWAARPQLPRRPIRAWQIWNEPNFKFFVRRPNPGEYGRLVRISSAAIASVDRGAQVILAGLFAQPKGARNPRTGKQKGINWFASDFIAAMYKRTPGVKRLFQGVSLHPYTGHFRHIKEQVEEMRSVLRAQRDAGKAIWLTEVSWSSQPPSPRNVFAKGPAGQAQQLTGAFNLIRRNQARWRVKRVYWFSVDDTKGACNFCDGSGLFGEGFKPKKSWFSFVRFAGGTP